MNIYGDDRGVSEILGSILVFGLILSLLAIVQVTAVPAQNEEIEFNHNQEVQQDLEELGAAASRVGASGRGESVSLAVGTRYPTRFLLLNPPPAEGTLRTSTAGTVILRNVATTGEAGDYWDGTTNRTYDLTAVTYTPTYNQYREAPRTVHEGVAVYNRFPNGASTLREESNVVRGNRISLTLLEGDLDRVSTDSTSVQLTPVSAPAQTVSVTATDPVFLYLPSDLPAGKWSELLEDEFTGSGGRVETIESVTGPGGEELVRIKLVAGTYDLRISRVGLGRDFTRPDPAYVTTVESAAQKVTAGTSSELTVQVRDGYNNPVPDVPLTVSLTSGSGTLSTTQVTTDDDGTAAVTYAPTSASSKVTFTGEWDGSTGTSAVETATFDVTSEFALASPTTGNATLDGVSAVNPGDEGSVILEGTSINTGNGKATLTLNNTGDDRRWIKQARISFYQGIAGSPNPSQAVIYADQPSSYRSTLVVGERFTNVETTPRIYLEPGTPTSVQLDFNGQVKPGSFFVLSVIYTDDTGDRSYANYFVGKS